MNLEIGKCVTAVIFSNFSGHYLRNRSTLDIGVLGYIGIVQHKEHPPEVWHIPPGTPCIFLFFILQKKLCSNRSCTFIHNTLPHSRDLTCYAYRPMRRWVVIQSIISESQRITAFKWKCTHASTHSILNSQACVFPF